MLTDRYCWLDPAPWYSGAYPFTRVAELKLYNSVNGVCMGPQPGWPIYESGVAMVRNLFYPQAMARSHDRLDFALQLRLGDAVGCRHDDRERPP